MPAKVRVFFIPGRASRSAEHAVDRYFKLAGSFGAILRDCGLRFQLWINHRFRCFSLIRWFSHPYAAAHNRSGANGFWNFAARLGALPRCGPSQIGPNISGKPGIVDVRTRLRFCNSSGF